MRLVQTLSSKGRGGMERAFLDWTLLLAQHGHSVHCVLPHESWTWQALAEARAARPELKIQCTGVTSFGLLNIGTLWSLWRVLRQSRCEAVLSHGARAHSLTALSRPKKLPQIAISHQASPRALKATHLIALTEQLRQHYLGLGFPARRISTIPNALPAACVPEPKPRVPAAEFARVGVLARLVPKKGVDVALRAFRLALDRGFRGELLIGGTGPEAASLKALSSELKLDGAVRFAGWVERPSDFFPLLDIFCIPSRDEPFGIVALEGLSQALPVIASKVGGLAEIIRDGDNGVLVPPDDVEALTQSLLTLAGDPARRARLAAAARASIAPYHPDAVGDRLDTAIRKMVTDFATESTP